ncbi:hypothetical protein RHMOL_Rhmol11G0050000 [Rhododendron molle]|uniref:Uncharacterized protein n=1 Tax=Rhododendron molle TaxID=49168 RepID=A0ACC0LPM1_RHOML|nr:hypothetical protein RHMOL_Rhmol11G0050000 [Rhododendron molle]
MRSRTWPNVTCSRSLRLLVILEEGTSTVFHETTPMPNEAIEQDRLNFVRCNQNILRSDLYSSLRDATSAGDADAVEAAEDKLNSPEEIDEVISAKIPDEVNDPLAFETIMRCMIHGSCGDGGGQCSYSMTDEPSSTAPELLSGSAVPFWPSLPQSFTDAAPPPPSPASLFPLALSLSPSPLLSPLSPFSQIPTSFQNTPSQPLLSPSSSDRRQSSTVPFHPVQPLPFHRGGLRDLLSFPLSPNPYFITEEDVDDEMDEEFGREMVAWLAQILMWMNACWPNPGIVKLNSNFAMTPGVAKTYIAVVLRDRRLGYVGQKSSFVI